jgi:hypothetical protein
VLSGVSFAAPGGGSCSASDAQGHYACTVPSGGSRTVTPSSSGYSFIPTSRTYTSVVTNQTTQDYTGSTLPRLANSVAGVLEKVITDPVKLPQIDGLAFARFANLFGVVEIANSGSGVINIDKVTASVTPNAHNIPGACRLDVHPNGDLYVSRAPRLSMARTEAPVPCRPLSTTWAAGSHACCRIEWTGQHRLRTRWLPLRR